MFHFRRITLFCLENSLSKHKMTVFSKNDGGMAPLATPMMWMVIRKPGITGKHTEKRKKATIYRKQIKL